MKIIKNINFITLPCKVCISTENNQKIQEELLKNNFRWAAGEKHFMYNVACIFIHSNKTMLYSSNAYAINTYEKESTIIEENKLMKYLGIL